MAVKFTLKEAGVSFIAAMAAEELLLLLLVVDDELLHAAARRPKAQTPAVMTNLLVLCLKETTLFIESSLRAKHPGRRSRGQVTIAAHRALYRRH
jgi:hypothetical protein